MTAIKTVGIAGTGVIGAGWACRMLGTGLDVIAFDPAEGAEAAMRDKIERGWPHMLKLMRKDDVNRGTLSFTRDVKEMAQNSDWIQEAAPEREDLKIRLFRDIDASAKSDAVIASSSSGFLPTRLQSQCRHPERVIIGHPFYPVYLLPLVETVAGEKTSAEVMDRADAFYRRIGMFPLRLKKEIDGYICDRLQEALWREALHCLNKGIGTTEDIDRAIMYSAGLRWAIMGSFLHYHLAGGDGGMRHFISQFDPTLELPWTDLPFPEWSDELAGKLIDGCEAQQGSENVASWEARRNDCLIDIMMVLKKHNMGVGEVLNGKV
jgi:carnitine 3-dehydrogenase